MNIKNNNYFDSDANEYHKKHKNIHKTESNSSKTKCYEKMFSYGYNRHESQTLRTWDYDVLNSMYCWGQQKSEMILNTRINTSHSHCAWKW
jgi:hypothetical protein